METEGLIVEFTHTEKISTPSSFTKLAFVALVIGLFAGLIGTMLILMTNFLEHIAYGYTPALTFKHVSFLDEVVRTSPLRRVLVLAVCGLIAGIGWFCIYKYGGKLIKIEDVVKSKKPEIPVATTLADSFLQLITISLGSPLGREVAHRKISMVFSGWILLKTGLNLKETKIMLACGAGAGFAAGYNIPIGGAIFALEVLLGSFRLSTIIPAFVSSVIAAAVTWVTIGNISQFHLPEYTLDYSILVWSCIVGPIFGVSAYGFNQINHKLSQKTTHNWQVPVFCFLSFVLIGILSIVHPSLLGNGRSLAQIGFDHSANLSTIAVLLILRLLIIWLVLRAGARGGILTPSIANGALLGAFLGGWWNMLWPSLPLGAFALIGAGAFLAAARNMPITATILIFELTGMRFVFLIPTLLAVMGSFGIYSLCMKKYSVKQRHGFYDEV